jgi:4-hydroxy-2-oxoheptanedioate aldolase
MMPSAFGAEILADTGIDFLMIDCQHGLIGYDAMVPMLQAVARTSVSPIVRVPPHDAARIGATLDAGAEGVVIPMVSTRQDAEEAVAGSRYPPHGQRSMGPIRSSMLLPGSTEDVNREVLCIMLVETVSGVENASAICSCPGVDVVMIGFVDLALSMGLPPYTESKELDDAIAAVTGACRDHGVVTMIGAGSPEQVQRRMAEGYRMLMLGSDYAILRAGVNRLLRGARDVVTKGVPQ